MLLINLLLLYNTTLTTISPYFCLEEMINSKIITELNPGDDMNRLEKLYQYAILDTAPEADFDNITALAAEIFETPSAFITFTADNDKVYFKAAFHSGTAIVPEQLEIFNATMLKREVVIYRDTREAPELGGKLKLTGTGELRFLAAVPIITSDGFILGALTVTDSVPHLKVTDRQIKMLTIAGSLIIENMDRRRTAINTSDTYQKHLRNMVHDIKNPVTTISLYAQLLGTASADKVTFMAEKIDKAAKTIERHLNQLAPKSKSAGK